MVNETRQSWTVSATDRPAAPAPAGEDELTIPADDSAAVVATDAPPIMRPWTGDRVPWRQPAVPPPVVVTLTRPLIAKVAAGLAVSALFLFAAGTLFGLGLRQAAEPAPPARAVEADRAAATPTPAAPEARAEESVTALAWRENDVTAVGRYAPTEPDSPAPGVPESPGTADASAAPPSPASPPAAKAATASATAKAAPPAGGGYLVQLGVFRDAGNAERLRRTLAAKGVTAGVSERTDAEGRVLHVVRAGSYPQRGIAARHAARLKGQGIDVFVAAEK